MADELTTRVEVSFTDGKSNPGIFSGNILSDLVATAPFVKKRIVATVAAANIALDGVSSPSTMLVWNEHASNYVEIGHDVAAAFEADVRVSAGRVALFECAQGTPQIRSNTTSCNVTLFFLE